MNNKEDSLKYIKQSFELKNQKMYKEAIEVLYKVLNENVDTETLVEVISQIGDLHLLLNNYDRAIEQYEHVLEIDENHEHSKNKLFEIYYKLQDFNKAEQFSKEACKNSNNPYDYVKYFTVLLKLKKPNEILTQYNMLSEDLQNNPELMYLITLLKYKDKKELLETIVKNAPDFTDAKFDLAMVYYNDEDYENANKLFDEILKIKKDALTYYYKALIQIKDKKYFLAINNLHLAIKASRGNIPEFYFELTKAYMEICWFEEAINTIKESITLYIKKGVNIIAIDRSYLLLAWVFEKKKDYDNALFNLTLISKDSPLTNEAKILKSVIDYKKGDIVKAKNGLETLYKEHPEIQNNLTLIDTLGTIYRKLKLNKSAYLFYEKHLKNFPDSIHTVCELVDLLIDMKEYDAAEKYINQYSKDKKIASFLNSRARIFYRKKEYDNAINSLNELIKCDKNNAEGYYFKGLILNKKENFEEAFKNIKTALELNPNPAKYYAQAALSNLKLKKYEDAMAYIKEAIEIEPNNLNYKKQAAEISKVSGNKAETGFWESIVKNTEKLIKENQRL